MLLDPGQSAGISFQTAWPKIKIIEELFSLVCFHNCSGFFVYLDKNTKDHSTTWLKPTSCRILPFPGCREQAWVRATNLTWNNPRRPLFPEDHKRPRESCQPSPQGAFHWLVCTAWCSDQMKLRLAHCKQGLFLLAPEGLRHAVFLSQL